MRALILAGGFGTRLRPLTFSRPKHLLPIANSAHIEHVLGLLQRHGISEAAFLTSYLAEAFEPTIAAARERGFVMEVAHEKEPLGTAGALKNGQDLVADDTFLAFNGDVLTGVDLGALVVWHKERGAEATIYLTPVEDPSAFGVVPTDADGRVESFIEKPQGAAPTNLINAGVYVLEPSILDRVPNGEVYSAERQLFPQLVEESVLFATSLPAYWRDIGTPESLLQANLDALDGTYPTDAVELPGPESSLIDPTARVAEDATVNASCIGAGAMVGPGSTVTSSVLMPDVQVGAGVLVERTILGEGVRVHDGAQVHDVTAGDGDEIGASR